MAKPVFLDPKPTINDDCCSDCSAERLHTGSSLLDGWKNAENLVASTGYPTSVRF